MKIFVAQQSYCVGSWEYNTKKIVDAIAKAKENKGDLLVFSELAICGGMPYDLLQQESFIAKCYAMLAIIQKHTQGIAVLIGMPIKNGGVSGMNLYNAALLLHDTKIKWQWNKTIFYPFGEEHRYFEPAHLWNTFELNGKKIAVTFYDDLHVTNASLVSPVQELMKHQPNVVITLGRTVFNYHQESQRHELLKTNALTNNISWLYCNTVGAQDGVVFDGDSLAYNKDGLCCYSAPMFQESLDSVVLQADGNFHTATLRTAPATKTLDTSVFDATHNIAHIHDALVLGIKEYFVQLGFTKAIVGLSGGIDSAVTVALACAALGNKNVLSVLMPSPFSTDHSVNDSVTLSMNLGNAYQLIPIKNMYESFLANFSTEYKNLPFSIAEENLQSRIRGVILMAVANKFGGYVLLNTSNKSELSVGYGTLYGDLCGGISMLGDCYKLQVYELAKYINRDKAIIPKNILDKAPSAELRPNQKDSDSLPNYNELDALLYQHIDRNQDATKLLEQGFSKKTIDKVLQLVNTNEYKRHQFCPIIQISARPFSSRKMPIVVKW